jgi:hypothetical protein
MALRITIGKQFRIAAAVFSLACIPMEAYCQRAAPLGATARPFAQVGTIAGNRDVGQPASPDSAKNIVGKSALTGAAIGAAAGAVLATIATQRSGVTDHSEDGFGYVVFMAAGALVGLVTGTIVGLVRR